MIRCFYIDRNLLVDSVINGSSYQLKVDTGAQLTVISLNKLVDDKDINKVLNLLQSKSTILGRSASGHELEGVFCKFENVKFDEVKLDYIYIGIIFNKDSDVALLGLDFLQGCTFSHSAGGDMFIESIDCSYQENMIKDTYGNCDKIYTIDEILSMCNIEDSLSILKSLA